MPGDHSGRASDRTLSLGNDRAPPRVDEVIVIRESMSPFGSSPLGTLIGGGPVNPTSDDLPWQLEAPAEADLRQLQTILETLTVEAPRPTLTFTSRSPALVVERLSTLYSDKSNLASYFVEDIGTKIDSMQLEDIATCLRQGKEFLRVAAGSDLITLPLTAHYCFLAYAAAAVLAAPEHETRLREFAIGHGIRVPKDLDVPLGQLRVRVKGKRELFQRLVEVCRQRSGLPLRARQKHAWVKIPSASSDDLQPLSITLQDLLARILGI